MHGVPLSTLQDLDNNLQEVVTPFNVLTKKQPSRSLVARARSLYISPVKVIAVYTPTAVSPTPPAILKILA